LSPSNWSSWPWQSTSKPANTAPAEAADRILASVQALAINQDDDLTLLVCDYLGAGPQPS
jgi:hypothetical protein